MTATNPTPTNETQTLEQWVSHAVRRIDEVRIAEADTATLIQWAANAIETANCMGHHKARMNDTAAAEYISELKSRGLKADAILKATTNVGIFNGAGSH